jgi:hypothetical protein
LCLWYVFGNVPKEDDVVLVGDFPREKGARTEVRRKITRDLREQGEAGKWKEKERVEGLLYSQI